MRRPLPPLHLLQVFDAAGRHLSFKRAAEELHVTPSAVSHQIKTLEGHLGIDLFQRGNRSLRLTEAGSAYLGVVEKTLARLRQGTERLLRDYTQSTLRINMIPALSRHVVIPHLDGLQQRLPDVQLHIETTERIVDFKTQEVDVALRYGMGRWPDVDSEKLLDLTCAPVCAPDLARQIRARGLLDLSEHRLIQMAMFPDAWPTWARAAGIGEFKTGRELWFDSYDATIQAAEQGLGLALALFPIEQRLIDSGMLAAAVESRVALPQSLYMVYRHGDAERPELRAFQQWFLEQFESRAGDA